MISLKALLGKSVVTSISYFGFIHLFPERLYLAA